MSRDASLCHTCAFVREVTGRRGQTYLMCKNDVIVAKYLPQPVLRCAGYAALKTPASNELPADDHP